MAVLNEFGRGGGGGGGDANYIYDSRLHIRRNLSEVVQ